MRSLFLLACLALAGCNCGPGGAGDPDGGKDGGGRGGGTGTGGGTGAGGGTGTGGGFGAGDDGGCVPGIVATMRDFQDTHPDFEHFLGAKTGIVQTQLGAGKKPVYGPPTGTPVVTSGQANFDQWYRDVPGVNITLQKSFALTQSTPGHFVYDNSAFFPLDGEGFGNQGRNHNFHFTTEIHASFVYKGGEVFTFRGDDDVFVFVNGRLALDLGGVHGAETGTVDFDGQAGQLGISRGNTYDLDVFHAERHTTESNFRIETTIDCLVPIIN